MICPKCKSINFVAGDKFCYKDGTPLVDEIPCECGRRLIREFKFCPSCGAANPEYVDPQANALTIDPMTKAVSSGS